MNQSIILAMEVPKEEVACLVPDLLDAVKDLLTDHGVSPIDSNLHVVQSG